MKPKLIGIILIVIAVIATIAGAIYFVGNMGKIKAETVSQDLKAMDAEANVTSTTVPQFENIVGLDFAAQSPETFITNMKIYPTKENFIADGVEGCIGKMEYSGEQAMALKFPSRADAINYMQAFETNLLNKDKYDAPERLKYPDISTKFPTRRATPVYIMQKENYLFILTISG